MTGEDLVEITATHEAGHAVMRYLRGLCATALYAGDGNGFCAGSGKRIDSESLLLVCLAGYAAETGCITQIDFSIAKAQDFDEAKQVLADCEWLRMKFLNSSDESPTLDYMNTDEAMEHHFRRTCEMLWPYFEVVTRLADCLASRRFLSARQVAAIIRHAVKREGM